VVELDGVNECVKDPGDEVENEDAVNEAEDEDAL